MPRPEPRGEEAVRRRFKAGGKPVRTRRRKAATLKRGNGPKAVGGRRSSAGGLNKKVALLARERDEALEQLTATSEVLHLMSGSHGELSRVFDTILTNAARLCWANFGILSLYEGGDTFRVAAMHNAPPVFAELR